MGPYTFKTDLNATILVTRLDHVNAYANDLIRHTDTQCGPRSASKAV